MADDKEPKTITMQVVQQHKDSPPPWYQVIAGFVIIGVTIWLSIAELGPHAEDHSHFAGWVIIGVFGVVGLHLAFPAPAEVLWEKALPFLKKDSDK